MLSPFVLALALAPAPVAPTGPDKMPILAGEFLTGRKAVLPDAAKGRVTLLALGFTYDSRFAVEAFIKQWRERFGRDPRTAFFEVPMLGGLARMGKWFINSGMKRGTPAAGHERVITVYGGTQAWKKRLNCNNGESACLVLLDAQGNLLWTRESLFNEAVWEELQARAAALLEAAN